MPTYKLQQQNLITMPLVRQQAYPVYLLRNVKIVIIAAPPILMVAPNGLKQNKVSSFKFVRRHVAIFTGMFAAELRVKKAVTTFTQTCPH